MNQLPFMQGSYPLIILSLKMERIILKTQSQTFQGNHLSQLNSFYSFLSNLKKTFEEPEIRDSISNDSNADSCVTFKTADKVYEFLLDVIQSLVTDRGKLA